MSKYPIAIVGCGSAAKNYFLPSLKNHEDLYENVLVVDKNINYAKEFAQELGSKYIFQDYKEIINKVRGVIIAVPHFLHYSLSLEFLKNHVHVLCEKPLAETTEEVKEMIAMSEKNKVTLSVHNIRRLIPSFVEVYNLMKSGKIGKIESIKYFEGNKFEWQSNENFYCNPRISSKGVLFDIGAHVLDIISYWLGGRFDVTNYEDDSFGGPESVIRLNGKYKNIDIKIFLTRMFDINSYFEILGDNGIIKGNVFDNNSIQLIDKYGKLNHIKLRKTTLSELRQKLVDNFIDIINGCGTPIISGKSVIDSIDIIDECYKNRKRFEMPWFDNLKELVNG